jgi:hypothetical protein
MSITAADAERLSADLAKHVTALLEDGEIAATSELATDIHETVEEITAALRDCAADGDASV